MKKIFLLLFIFHFSSYILQAQHYFLYGEATQGGTANDGILFRFDPFTGKDTVLINFSGLNGSGPGCYLSLQSNGIIYGICGYGGTHNDGILFSYNLTNNTGNTTFDFMGLNGAGPGGGGGAQIFSNGILYGTAGSGGKYNAGVIFSYNPVSSIDSAVFSFKDTNGTGTDGGLFVLNDTSFYGMTSEGGLYNYGVIYRFNPLTNRESVLFNFNGSTDGGIPQGAFIKDSNGILYGVTGQLGMYGDGTLISFNPMTNTESTLVSFDGINGKYSFGDLFLASDSLLYGMTELGGSKNDGVLFSYNVRTNSENIVTNFDSVNGKYPNGGGVIEDIVNKILYGMTLEGGKYNEGVIFSYNLITKKDSVLFNFNGTKGANPSGALLMVYDTSTGINEVKSEIVEVKTYPNPNNGKFTLSLSNISSKCILEIYNVLGESIYKTTLNSYNTEINLNGQPAGVYFYRVLKGDGGLVGSGKVIIEK